MNRFFVILLATAVAVGVSVPRAAAIDLGLGLFKKKPKTEPPTRVKQLIAILQSDQDEKKRLAAAEELRSFDPRNNSDMTPALIGSLQQDPSPAVRAEAAETLGRLKPVDQPAGLALEAAQESDPAAAVREAAKSALWQYHLNGYRSPTTVAGERTQTAEPPLSTRRTTTANRSKTSNSSPIESGSGFRTISNGVGKPSSFYQTGEPPLARLTGAKPTLSPEPTPTNPTSTVVLPTPQPSSAVPEVQSQPFPLPMPAPTTMPSSPLPVTTPTFGAPTFAVPPVPTITPPPG